LALLAIGTIWLLGCSKERTESQTPPEQAGRAQPSGESAKPTVSGDTIATAQTVEGIWDQITLEQEKVSAAIQSGQLKELHHRGNRIRDLVGTLAEKAVVTSPETAPRLKGLGEQVKASATDLGEMGDAGDLKGAETESAKLNAILAAVKDAVKLE
jgi:hypothetical protein